MPQDDIRNLDELKSVLASDSRFAAYHVTGAGDGWVEVRVGEGGLTLAAASLIRRRGGHRAAPGALGVGQDDAAARRHRRGAGRRRHPARSLRAGARDAAAGAGAAVRHDEELPRPRGAARARAGARADGGEVPLGARRAGVDRARHLVGARHRQAARVDPGALALRDRRRRGVGVHRRGAVAQPARAHRALHGLAERLGRDQLLGAHLSRRRQDGGGAGDHLARAHQHPGPGAREARLGGSTCRRGIRRGRC